MSKVSKPRERGGCLSLAGTVLLGGLMLVINGAVVVAAYSTLVATFAKEWRSPQVSQLVYFLGPVIMLVMEWWVIDILADRTRRRRDRLP